MKRDVRVVGDVGSCVVAPLSAAGWESVADVLRFGLAQRPSWDIAEIVVQDEFTHDIVIAIAIAGPAPVFLVLDTT